MEGGSSGSRRTRPGGRKRLREQVRLTLDVWCEDSIRGGGLRPPRVQGEDRYLQPLFWEVSTGRGRQWPEWAVAGSGGLFSPSCVFEVMAWTGQDRWF